MISNDNNFFSFILPLFRAQIWKKNIKSTFFSWNYVFSKIGSHDDTMKITKKGHVQWDSSFVVSVCQCYCSCFCHLLCIICFISVFPGFVKWRY